MTTFEIRQQIERFRLWATQSETLGKIPNASDSTKIKGQAFAGAYRHCADTLERALESRHASPTHIGARNQNGTSSYSTSQLRWLLNLKFRLSYTISNSTNTSNT